jgi:spore coat polysaccharide biosynthesis protein SpsF (cytidylyltransferase family)
MSFYWRLYNGDTGEIIENDYPFATYKLTRLSVLSYIKRHKVEHYTFSIPTHPFNLSKQYKINPNKTLENNRRFLIVDKHMTKSLNSLYKKLYSNFDTTSTQKLLDRLEPTPQIKTDNDKGDK